MLDNSTAPKIAVIILNWNGWKDTIECLESIYQITYPSYEVIVVDNGSQDNSVEKIKEWAEGKIKVESKFLDYNPNNKPIYVLEYTKEQAERGGNFRWEKYFSKLPPNRKLRLVLNDKNYGFAEGNNIGIRYAINSLNPDYIFLLNNDAVVDPSFLTEIVKAAESDGKIGICGGKMLRYDDPNEIDSSGFTVDLFGYANIRCTVTDDCFEAPYASGGGMLVRRRLIEEMGNLFDPDYFLYHEDLDAGWRCRLLGYKVVITPNAVIYHKGSATVRKFNYNAYYYTERNRLITLLKNYHFRTLVLLSPLLLINETLRTPVLLATGKLGAKARGWMWIVKNLHEILRKRENVQEGRRARDEEILKLHEIGFDDDFTQKNPIIVGINFLIRMYCTAVGII